MGLRNPPLWDGSFDVFVLQRYVSLSQYAKENQRQDGTQVGAQMQEYDSGDNDNDHGEE